MNLEKYETLYDSSNYSYKFISVGPKGIIKKVVQFEKITHLKGNIYNLTFGDWNENKGSIDDLVISNNNDTKKLLFTVAFTVMEFVSYFPSANILIIGSTNSRTRLYQMAISKNIKDINEHFEIQGLRNGYWERIKPGINFEAFLVKSRGKKL